MPQLLGDFNKSCHHFLTVQACDATKVEQWYTDRYIKALQSLACNYNGNIYK